jgi:hypothetical protein
LVVLLLGAADPTQFVRATAACFIAVYVIVLASAVRILRSRMRILATVTLALTVVLAAFSSWYLLVPAVAGAIAFVVRRQLLHADGWSRAATARGDGATTR